MNEKLSLIKHKCFAANPEITERRFYEGSGVRLCDVLLAIGNAVRNVEAPYISIAEAGRFVFLHAEEEGWMFCYADGTDNVITWNLLADDLEKQSEETINFLHELLK